ncbi:hypothetical protein LTR53_019564, partial [Teratosphaeriaceae sp. CCFEE 6253]
MKIAVTGSSGTVGKEVVDLCMADGHQVVQIDLAKPTSSADSDVKIVDVASDYHGFVDALRGCEALVHLAAIPNPVNRLDATVHNSNVSAAFNGFRACGELGTTRIAYASS